MKYSVSTAKPATKPVPTGYKCKVSGKVYWRADVGWYFFNSKSGMSGSAYVDNQYDNENIYEPIYDDIVITISRR